MTLNELHDRFCSEAAHINNLTKDTVRWYRDGFSILQTFKPLRHLHEIDELILTDFLLWGREHRNWKPKTMLDYYGSLSSFFNWCENKRLIPKNPLKHIPRPKIPRTIPKALSETEARQVLESVQYLPVPKTYRHPTFHKKRDIAIFATFLFTGLRRQELLNLKLHDVNFEEAIVVVRSGKGQKDRIIPLSFELKRLLQAYLEERSKLGIDTEYIFTSLQKQKKLGVRTLTRMFQRVKEASRVNFTTHQLRHTFATLMAESQCDAFALCDMMGHSDIKTTMVYVKTRSEHKRKQINNHPLNYL
ncbi:conserved hypothetical protein [Candidatus Terasakiella magnetica]|uniref:Uncharacterized protein n=2 Tax=Candidatus Terasakiella magnetica TaxID=1867952 RepID=A0A1C3RHH4_9PROT|nr:conserved hypothetical protein [Candidatus Terasakiella magnetica]